LAYENLSKGAKIVENNEYDNEYDSEYDDLEEVKSDY
jgi:hypothetical protein